MKKPAKPPADSSEARADRVAIGQRLRDMFDEVVNEPVPDEFMELLRRADERRLSGEAGAGRADD